MAETSAAPVPPPSGDPASFDALLLPLLPRIHRYALRLTGDADEADDLVQTAYLDALRGWHTFRPGSDPARWLFTICRHAFYRRHRRRPDPVPLDAPELESLEGTMQVREALSDQGTAAKLTAPDVQDALDAAIAALPEELRFAVLAVDVEGFTYEETAQQLAIPVGTVRSRLYRARRLLQARLLHHAEDAGIIRAVTTEER